MASHGDGISDICIEVEDIDKIIATAKNRGADIVSDVTESGDEFGTVKSATVRAFGDVFHTFIDKKDYKGEF